MLFDPATGRTKVLSVASPFLAICFILQRRIKFQQCCAPVDRMPEDQSKSPHTSWPSSHGREVLADENEYVSLAS